MSVQTRLYKGREGVWEYEITTKYDDGSPLYKRLKSPRKTEPQTRKFGEAEERRLLKEGNDRIAAGLKAQADAKRKVVPTFDAWRAEYLEICADEGLKESSLETKRTYYKKWIAPVVGKLSMDALEPSHVKDIKRALRTKGRSGATIEHAVNELRAMLNCAVEQRVLAAMPFKVKSVRRDKTRMSFYSREELEALLSASSGEAHLAILLGAHAGLRRAEICGLAWADINWEAGKITITRTISASANTEDDDDEDDEIEDIDDDDSTKGRRSRTVPMSKRLIAALRAHRHLRGPRVFYNATGLTILGWVRDAISAARLPQVRRPVHRLRHTFCSHMAMAGVHARVIQELAGHSSLLITQQYMHLAPTAAADAVRTFDEDRRDISETPEQKTVSG